MKKYGKVKIFNFRTLNTEDTEGFVMIDCSRKNPILGNPFKMKGTSVVERDRVCELFDRHFEKEMSKVSDMSRLVYELIKLHKAEVNIGLICWCFPKRCHTQTILKHITTA